MAKPNAVDTVPGLLEWMEAAIDLVQADVIDLAHVRRELKRFRKLCSATSGAPPPRIKGSLLRVS